jgi:hypothetical protein
VAIRQHAPDGRRTRPRDVADGRHPPRRSLWLRRRTRGEPRQAVLLPLVYLQIIGEFHVTPPTSRRWRRAGTFASRLIQLSFAADAGRVAPDAAGQRRGSRSRPGARDGLPELRGANIASRIGAPPASGRQRAARRAVPEERRGFAISAHISGGNVGTVVVAVLGAAMIAALGWWS